MFDPFTIYAGGSLAVSALSSLFGGNDSSETEPYRNQLQDLTKQSIQTSNESRNQAEGVLSPALDYLKAITGGDRQALLQATMPERRRVIDQYNTAKQSIAEMAPRGGGQVSALAGLEAKQAGDLASIGSEARGSAVNTLAQLGLGLKQTAGQSDAQAGSNISQIIQTILQHQAASGQSAASLGESLSTVLGLLFLKDKNKAAGVSA